MDAADVRGLDILPVYMDFANRFWIGSSLRDIAKYRPRPPLGQQVTFRWGDNGPVICAMDGTVIQAVDVVMPVFHGTFGEDGRTLFITAGDRLVSVRCRLAGLGRF